MTEIILLTVIGTIAFSLTIILFNFHKRSRRENNFTYWFKNVDEIL
jgi:hypothetical protein